jgi:carbonic anhydrase
MLMCMDFRFQDWVPAKVADLTQANSYDLISYAGGALTLGSDDAAEREILLSQIRLSSRLHGINSVVLVDHEDCGAYGGSKAFASSDEELACHKGKMTKARVAIAEQLPHLRVLLSYAWLDGTVNLL